MANFSENKIIAEINAIFRNPSSNVTKTFNAYQTNVTLIETIQLICTANCKSTD